MTLRDLLNPTEGDRGRDGMTNDLIVTTDKIAADKITVRDLPDLTLPDRITLLNPPTEGEANE